MRPDISEFSYGHALTESLINNRSGLRAAPIFPSLFQEGKKHGYDVEIPFRGSVLFLQFKLSDCMVSRRTPEVSNLNFSVPFFRVHLRSGKHSQQHSLLLSLERSGQSVFYAAPLFSDSGSFNKIYLNGTIINESVFVKPRAIGRLDNKEHYFAFERTGFLYLFSDPKKLLEDTYFGQTFFEEIQKNEAVEINDAFFEELSNQLVDIVKNATADFGSGIVDEYFWKKLSVHSSRARIAIIARSIFGCEPLVISR